MKHSYFTGAALALALTACSGGGEANNSAEETATALQPGEYEVTATVEALRSTDKSTPATKLTQGSAPVTTRTCVGSDNAVEPAAFVEAGDSCKPGETYMSNGRMSLQFQCTRKGKGNLTNLADGKFEKDSFSGKVITTTYFSGSGDYELTRAITGKRVGDCTSKAG